MFHVDCAEPAVPPWLGHESWEFPAGHALGPCGPYSASNESRPDCVGGGGGGSGFPGMDGRSAPKSPLKPSSAGSPAARSPRLLLAGPYDPHADGFGGGCNCCSGGPSAVPSPLLAGDSTCD